MIRYRIIRWATLYEYGLLLVLAAPTAPAADLEPPQLRGGAIGRNEVVLPDSLLLHAEPQSWLLLQRCQDNQVGPEAGCSRFPGSDWKLRIGLRGGTRYPFSKLHARGANGAGAFTIFEIC